MLDYQICFRQKVTEAWTVYMYTLIFIRRGYKEWKMVFLMSWVFITNFMFGCKAKQGTCALPCLTLVVMQSPFPIDVLR